jgi:signal transduction histidine kinase
MIETVAGKGAQAPGRWRLVLRHKLGSVERAVEAALVRNLAVAFSVLGVLGASVVLIAASARRSRALAEQQMEFVAAVSHELRTPLAVIRSAGENLADGVVSDPPQVKRYGGIVRDEGLRLSEMVEQVLSFAGADARSREQEPVDLVSVAERALAAEGTGIERDFAAELPRARGDAAAIERAIRNLIGNARKYAGEAAIGLRLESRPESSPPSVAIVVWDHGPGIDPEERGRLFEPFFRGKNARDAQMPGSGLGLAVVRRIAESLGGRVDVESVPGRGAAFTLLLEAAPGVVEPATDVQAHPAR